MQAPAFTTEIPETMINLLISLRGESGGPPDEEVINESK